MLVGAIFMLWSDTAARSLFDPRELPVGIVTALIGAPGFPAILLALPADDMSGLVVSDVETVRIGDGDHRLDDVDFGCRAAR